MSEEALREFSMMFKHFDKDKSGKLNHQEFRSCLRALGYDLPMVEEGQRDPEFEAFLDSVDPNRCVSAAVTSCMYLSIFSIRCTCNSLATISVRSMHISETINLHGRRSVTAK